MADRAIDILCMLRRMHRCHETPCAILMAGAGRRVYVPSAGDAGLGV